MLNPDKDLVVTPEALTTAGCVSYWRVSGNIEIAALHRAWVAAGLDPALIRKAPEPETAFRRAVLDLARRERIVIAGQEAERRTLVRPCKEPHTWAIVEEIVQQGEAPMYTTLVIASCANGAPQFQPIAASDDQLVAITAAASANFAAQQGQFDPADITTWLVKLAYANGAVTLRDSGGVYFIPRPAVDFWSRAATVIETVSQRAHQIFRIPAMRNAEAVEAIVTAVTAEAEQVAKEIEDQINAGLGARALETRKAAASALLAKVASYETLVGQQIAVRERVEALQASLATAALALMVSDDAPAATA
jgi:hypothetical protein